MSDSGYAGSYTEDNKKAVIYWLRHHGVQMRRNAKVKGSENTLTQASSMSLDVF
jgi:hypothetical protein